MNIESFEKIINGAWENKSQVSKDSDKKLLDAISETINLLDSGKLRVAEKKNNKWLVNQWAKKAILLSFKVNEMETVQGPYATWFDKVKGKTSGWTKEQHLKSGFRFVPNGVIRKGAYIAKNVVLMPSFVNLGAYVDEGTMIDTWASVGSCAQVGKNCHISGGAGIGGVLEPMQANPTIIEDNCFVGAGAVIVEGIQVLAGAVIAPGVILSKGTPIYDAVNEKQVTDGIIPEGAVVVPGTRPVSAKLNWAKEMGLSLNCAIIVKYRDEKTDGSLQLEEFLR